MSFRMTLGAEQQKIGRIVRSSVFNFNDVVYLQSKRWPKRLQMLLTP